MTHEPESTGTRLARLRRAQNITQEALADRLGVSRQAVSKWESDLTYPETDKLLRLSRLYGVTVDYLLTGDDTVPPKTAVDSDPTVKTTVNATVDPPCHTGASPQTDDGDLGRSAGGAASPDPMGFSWVRRCTYEYKSRRTVGGIPLIHINIGRGRTATGIVAFGTTARGVVAVGLAAVGVLSFGLASVGLFSVGLVALGLLMAIGSIAVGGMAIGAVAVGLVAIGALSAGLISVGALAVGRELAVGDWACGEIAIGKTVAKGALFAHQGSLSLSNAERETVTTLLEQHCPSALRLIARAVMQAACH